MMFVEFQKEIINKLSRMNLDQFISERAQIFSQTPEDFSVDVWCDAILAWIGKQFPAKDKTRIEILERTKFDYREYFDACSELIDSYNKRAALRRFSDALFAEREFKKPDPVPDLPPEPIQALAPLENPDVPPRALVELAERFKTVFGEGPDKIRVRTSFEKIDPNMPNGKDAEQFYRTKLAYGLR